MKIISSPLSKKVVLARHRSFFKKLVKAVVDVEEEIIAIDAELHADLEGLLLENGSKQENLWGINLYLEKEKEDLIEYTALINIRPAVDNRSMEVEDSRIRSKIEGIVTKLLVG